MEQKKNKMRRNWGNKRKKKKRLRRGVIKKLPSRQEMQIIMF